MLELDEKEKSRFDGDGDGKVKMISGETSESEELGVIGWLKRVVAIAIWLGSIHFNMAIILFSLFVLPLSYSLLYLLLYSSFFISFYTKFGINAFWLYFLCFSFSFSVSWLSSLFSSSFQSMIKAKLAEDSQGKAQRTYFICFYFIILFIYVIIKSIAIAGSYVSTLAVTSL